MDLNCETILDVYTYKNRKILCQIKVNSNSGKLKNCRCLSQEQWMVFDKNLNKLIATIDDWSDEKCLKFDINPCILVKIQKSSLSLKHFNQCLGISSGFDGELEEANYILECLFDFKREYLFSPTTASTELDLYTESTLDCLPCSPLSYDPYTPSKKDHKTNKSDTVKTPGIDFLECDRSTYSPKSISEKETNGTPATDIKQRPELESTNTTRCSSKSNQNANLPDAVAVDTECKTNSCLNSPSSSEEQSHKKSDCSKNENAFISPDTLFEPKKNQECCTAKGIKANTSSQTNILKNSRERSKSEDFLLELKNENIKEEPRAIRKKLKTGQSYGCHYNITSKNAAATDVFSEKSSTETEDTRQKKKIVKENKESHKKADEPLEIHAKKIKKKASSALGKNTTEEQHENSLTEEQARSSVDVNNSSESTIEMSPEKVRRRHRKLKSCCKEAAVSLRRSERSPSKPKRFREEQTEFSTKSRKKQKSKKIDELFGTDDDEDHLFETKNEKVNSNDKKNKLSNFGTPVSKKPVECPSSSSSQKTKSKRDKSAECQQEKRDMSKWLSKKPPKHIGDGAKTTAKSTSKSTSLSKALPLKSSRNEMLRTVESHSKSRSQSVSPSPMTIELPSKAELELMRNKTSLMREENARMKAELDKMRTSPPKEVEILSLQNIPEDKILSTFFTYKDELDEIFRNNRKRDYIKGHDGINHYFIMKLLQHSTQRKMLDKLTDVYGSSDTTTQATLFANALFPEWVIRVFMEKFSFTRQQAIDQIKAQEAFQLHMEYQNETLFEFD